MAGSLGSGFSLRARKALESDLRDLRGDPEHTLKIRFGTIIGMHTGASEGKKVIAVYVKFDEMDDKYDQSSFPVPLSLAYPVDVVSHLFGDDLVGRRCRVEFYTPSPAGGRVTITTERNFSGDAGKAGKVPAAVTIMSPAGG